MSLAFWSKWPFLWKFRLVGGLILLAVISGFGYFKIVPGGRIVYEHSWPAGLKSGQGFIYEFKPGERLDPNDRISLKMIAEPLYFSLFTPRRFDQVRLTLTYRDHLSSTTPIIEVGVLTDNLSGRYELRPVRNNILDRLLGSWHQLGDSRSPLILAAKENYATPAEFNRDLAAGALKGCPGTGQLADCLAVYNYDQPLSWPLPAGSTVTPFVVTQPLRGPHQFYVYFKNGPWRLNFDFVDLNLDPAPDPLNVTLFSGDQIIANQALADNNSATASGQTENKNIILKGDFISAGVYKLDVNISPDVVLARLESSSDKLVARHKIWPVSGAGALTVFTDGNYLQAWTSNPASLGQIDLAGRPFDLNRTDRPFSWPLAGGQAAVKLKKDDIILETNGVFAFTAAGLFDPAVPTVDRFFSPDQTRYILADYTSPVLAGDLKIATAEFNLRAAYREKGKYTFLISVPGLSGEEEESYLDIKQIRIELRGKTLWQKIWE